MQPESDIDLLVVFLPGAQVNLVDYAGLMLDLSRLLGRKVDLVSKKGLKPLIRTAVLEEGRRISTITLPGSWPEPITRLFKSPNCCAAQSSRNWVLSAKPLHASRRT